MPYTHFLQNDSVLPIDQAVLPLTRIEYTYGFGVYETIRVTQGVPFFLAEHLQRLQESAATIELEHGFTSDRIEQGLRALIEKNAVVTANIKVLLLGGPTAAAAMLYAFCSNPLFPDRKLYRDGAVAITVPMERFFPQAKTLNMLPSYLAYRQATRAGAYDALLVNRHGQITEGTRTNFFCIKGQTVFSPPESEILLGVTRKAVLQVAQASGYEVEERAIQPIELAEYDGAFLTSTSSKIMPLRQIGEFRYQAVPDQLKQLITLFDEFLAGCGGKLG